MDVSSHASFTPSDMPVPPVPLSTLRAAWALTLIGAPDRVLGAVRAPITPATRRVTRILGARHLLQAAAVGLVSRPSIDRVSRRVDAAHGASMVMLAAGSPVYRRAGLTSALVSAALVALDPRGRRRV
jgi:hypothetical protein